MPRQPDPTLETIEADQADVSVILEALGDVARLWKDLDDDAALTLLLGAFKAAKRIKQRAKERHTTFSEAWQKAKSERPNEH